MKIDPLSLGEDDSTLELQVFDQLDRKLACIQCLKGQLWMALFDLRGQLQCIDAQYLKIRIGLLGQRVRVSVPFLEFCNHFYVVGLAQELNAGKLTAYFQPIVSCRGLQKIYGYELLARYCSEGSCLSAPELFGTAIGNPAKLELQNLAWIACLRARRQVPIGLQAFVNLNPDIFFMGVASLERLDAELIDSGYPTELTTIEILESDVPYDRPSLSRLVDALRSRGFKIALDDWGIQSRGLDTLNLIRPEFVKLEMELVRDCQNDPYRQRLVEGAIELSRRLDVKMILEGIETDSDFRWASSSGCELIQGHAIGRAVPSPQKPVASALVLPPMLSADHLVPWST